MCKGEVRTSKAFRTNPSHVPSVDVKTGVCVCGGGAGQKGKGCKSHMAACLLSHCWQERLSLRYWRTSHSMFLLFRSSSRACFTCSYILAPESENKRLSGNETHARFGPQSFKELVHFCLYSVIICIYSNLRSVDILQVQRRLLGQLMSRYPLWAFMN